MKLIFTFKHEISMGIYIYNTQSRKKEKFKSLSEKKIRIYVCGPTVYDHLHVGNFRGLIFFNLVRNWFEKKGFEVNFVYNYTDVDDKIIDRALKEGVSPKDLSEKYIKIFEEEVQTLNLKKPTRTPKVTEYIKDIIDFIDELISKNKAYEKRGSVYFDVQSFSKYGTLSNKNIHELMQNESIEEGRDKKHPSDFALWKKSKSNEPFWDSPWGRGRPGWHIECSTMIRSLLGDSIDIHGGGIDLVFPHHENELSQSEACTGKTFVHYWMHNNMLEFENQKMSKSLGNIQTYSDFLKNYNPEIFKFLMLSVHYRSILNFSPSQIGKSLVPLARIYSSLSFSEKMIQSQDSLEESQSDLKDLSEEMISSSCKTFAENLKAGDAAIEKALNDDFNTPIVIAKIFEIIKLYNFFCRRSALDKNEESQCKKVKSKNLEVKDEILSLREKGKISHDFFKWVRKWGKLMSLFQELPEEFLTHLDNLLLKREGLKREDIDRKVSERMEARKKKDFNLADQIRKSLTSMGISLQDLPNDKTIWEVSKNV